MVLFLPILYDCLVLLLFLLCMMILFCPSLLLLFFLMIPSFKFIIPLMMIFLMKYQKHLLILLQTLFPLEGLLGLLKDPLICRSSIAIKLLLSSLCLLPNQVLLIHVFLMLHITTFLPLIKLFAMLFLLLLNLNFITKLCLIPNGKLP